MKTGLVRRIAVAALVGAGLVATVGTPQAGAVFPGNNGKIAYTKITGAGGEIFTMKSDGSAKTQLTDNSVNDNSPSFNKAGTKIVFVHGTNDEDGEIYTMSATGGSLARLTNNNWPDKDPSWAANGTKIYFSRKLSDGDYEIFSMDADGSNQMQLTNNGTDDREAVENGAGTTVLYTHVNGAGHIDLWTMSPTGASETLLVDCANGRECTSPDWAPQGNRITYSRWNFDTPASVVYIANADGTNKQPQTAEGGYNNYSGFSPDGTFLIWSGVDDVFRYNLSTGGLFRMTSDTPVEWGPDWQAT